MANQKASRVAKQVKLSMSECNGRYEESGVETYQSIPGKIYGYTH